MVWAYLSHIVDGMHTYLHFLLFSIGSRWATHTMNPPEATSAHTYPMLAKTSIINKHMGSMISPSPTSLINTVAHSIRLGAIQAHTWPVSDKDWQISQAKTNWILTPRHMYGFRSTQDVNFPAAAWPDSWVDQVQVREHRFKVIGQSLCTQRP